MTPLFVDILVAAIFAALYALAHVFGRLVRALECKQRQCPRCQRAVSAGWRSA